MQNRLAALYLALLALLLPAPAHAQVSPSGGIIQAFGGGVIAADVAFDSINKVYLVVSASGQGGMLRGQFVSPSGQLLGSTFVIQSGSLPTHYPRVAFSPDAGAFLVTWHETILGNSSATTVRCRLVSYTGGLISADTVLSSADSAWTLGASVAYASGSRQFMVVWQTPSYDIHGIFVSNAGQVASNILQVAATPAGERDPTVAYNSSSDEFMVLYTGWGNGLSAFAKAQRVSASTSANLGAPTVLDNTTGTFITGIGYDPVHNRYLASWFRSPGGEMGMLLNADGSPASSVTPISGRFAAYDALGISYNPTSGTFFIVSQDQLSDADGGVEVMPTPLSSGYLETLGNTTLIYYPEAFNGGGNFYPRLATNTDSAQWMMAADHDFNVTFGQLFTTATVAAGCSMSVSASGTSVGTSGGAGSIAVSASGTGSCNWTASSNASWVTVTSGSSGTNSGNVTFTVAPTSSSRTRSAVISVAGGSVTITQAGLPCNNSLSPSYIGSISGAIGVDRTGTLTLTTSVSDCSWTITSASPGLTFDALSGTGTASIHFNIAPNLSTSARAGSAFIGGQTFSYIEQGAATNTTLMAQETATTDFSGDGHSDLLWQDLSGGNLAVWNLSGGTGSRTAASFPYVIADTNWRIVGTGDFNADGHPDIVWWNQATGQLYLWYMNGVTRIGSAGFSVDGMSDTRWKVVAVADFNGDGTPDLLWQHDYGYLTIWETGGAGGTTFINFVDPTPDRVLDSNWRVMGATDMTGDGQPDIIFKHAVNGQVIVWLMSGTARTSFVTLGTILDQNWTLGSVIDLDGDQTPDLVWQNVATGSVAVWFMNGTDRASVQSFPFAVKTNWRLVGPR